MQGTRAKGVGSRVGSEITVAFHGLPTRIFIDKGPGTWLPNVGTNRIRYAHELASTLG